VSPSSGGFGLITLGLTMAIIGGRDSWIGAVVGAYIVTWVPEWLRFVGTYRSLVFGLVLVGVMLFFPDGLLGAVRKGIARIRRKPAPDIVADAPEPELAGTAVKA
jgi:branched-chain amino acid transport system permease protein